MKDFILASCLLLSLFFAKPVLAIEGKYQIFADLMTRDNQLYTKVIAKTIVFNEIQDLELIDFCAELVAKRLDKEIMLSVDTAAWLIRAIGTSKSRRYQYFLTQLLNSDEDSKLKKYARSALKKTRKRSKGRFFKGAVDLDAFRQKVDQQRKDINSFSAVIFSKIKTHQPLAQVLELMGTPTKRAIVSVDKSQTANDVMGWNHLYVRFGDAGRVMFDYAADKKSWIVKGMETGPVSVNDFTLHPMAAVQAGALKSYVEHLYHNGKATRFDLDLAAERLYGLQQSKKYRDAASWVCRLLGTSQSARYRTVLEVTVQSARYNKLKKYAAKALAELPEQTVEQYTRGDVYAIRL
ncbi:MAG: hypothetical protein HRT35_23040 [Algicola sp.]|nr:hypothetical protein [Algicola sp.]